MVAVIAFVAAFTACAARGKQNAKTRARSSKLMCRRGTTMTLRGSIV
jgi:hypothetical protein